jgi:hypothetical protein
MARLNPKSSMAIFLTLFLVLVASCGLKLGPKAEKIEEGPHSALENPQQADEKKSQ